MGEKDIVQKLLEDHEDVFADILNVFLFQGKREVNPEELSESGTRSGYKADTGKCHEQERDVGKYWIRDGKIAAFFGIENQMAMDRDMPLRIAGYDGADYRSQLLKEKQKQRYPVVTLVLYYGEKRWEKGKMLSARVRVPENLRGYINEYAVNLYEISYLTKEQLEQFQSDFGIIAEYFACSREEPGYIPRLRKIRHVDEFLKMMAVFTGDERYEEMKKYFKEKEDVTMCKVLDYRERIGRRQGEDAVRVLFAHLMEEGKTEAMKRAVKDADFCEQLLKGYGLE